MRARLTLSLAFVTLSLLACGGSSIGALGGVDGGVDGGAGACPSFSPQPEEGCAVDGAQCHYDCAHGGASDATCSGGKWDVVGLTIPCLPQDAGGDAGDGGDASDAAPPPKSFACGTASCRGDQYCVEPCCGGPAPQCVPALDGGACPVGTQEGTCYPGGHGCVQAPCTPAPPYCSDTNSSQQSCMPVSPGSHTLQCLCA